MNVLRAARPGTEIDATAGMYPSRLLIVAGQTALATPSSTYYGYVVAGVARIATGGLDVRGGAGSFFAAPGPVELDADGVAVVIERLGFRGIPTFGSIEAAGRLAYIDGCSDSVLVSPPRLGDPVLNHLHFPAGTVQSVHSHPSIRLGVVARGSGTAFGPGPRGSAGWEQALEPGAAFLLEAHEPHAFRTAPGASLDVIAYHPDSDWGPTDAAHPMLNRTYVKSR
jgi:hypothetical protein